VLLPVDEDDKRRLNQAEVSGHQPFCPECAKERRAKAWHDSPWLWLAVAFLVILACVAMVLLPAIH